MAEIFQKKGLHHRPRTLHYRRLGHKPHVYASQQRFVHTTFDTFVDAIFP